MIRWIRRTVRGFWRWLNSKLRKDWMPYCHRCDGCGEDPCCKVERCDGGPFCAKYYGDARDRAEIIRERDPR